MFLPITGGLIPLHLSIAPLIPFRGVHIPGKTQVWMEQIKGVGTANGNSEGPAKSDCETTITARLFKVLYSYICCASRFLQTYSHSNSPDMKVFLDLAITVSVQHNSSAG